MNKKWILPLAIFGVLLVAAAAFVGGRLFNGGFGPGGLFSIGGPGGPISMSIEVIPAPELPTTAPELTGTFAERQDNTIYLQTFSMETGGGGVVVSVAPGSGEGAGPALTTGPAANTGPKVEVVVTSETLIYADVTPMEFNPDQENVRVQQTVAPGSLDELTTQTMVTVWGRKVGDRVIADVIAYSNPIMIQMP